MLSKERSSTIFWVLGMTQPEIKPRSPDRGLDFYPQVSKYSRISCHILSTTKIQDMLNTKSFEKRQRKNPTREFLSYFISHTHTHTHTHIYIYIYICVCVCVCVCVCACVCMSIRVEGPKKKSSTYFQRLRYPIRHAELFYTGDNPLHW